MLFSLGVMSLINPLFSPSNPLAERNVAILLPSNFKVLMQALCTDRTCHKPYVGHS